MVSDPAMRLRAQLLTGQLNAHCQRCTARRKVPVAELESAVHRYLAAPDEDPIEVTQGELVTASEIVLPEDFDPAIYLAMYPDLQAAEVDPAERYLTHGQFEGRAYKPA